MQGGLGLARALRKTHVSTLWEWLFLKTELFLLRTVVTGSRFPEVKLSHFCLRREHRESPGGLCSLCRAAGSALLKPPELQSPESFLKAVFAYGRARETFAPTQMQTKPAEC